MSSVPPTSLDPTLTESTKSIPKNKEYQLNSIGDFSSLNSRHRFFAYSDFELIPSHSLDSPSVPSWTTEASFFPPAPSISRIPFSENRPMSTTQPQRKSQVATCHNCAAPIELTDRVKYCGDCGTKIRRGGPWLCVNCGFDMQVNCKYCSCCGHLQTGKVVKDDSDSPPSGNRYTNKYTPQTAPIPHQQQSARSRTSSISTPPQTGSSYPNASSFYPRTSTSPGPNFDNLLSRRRSTSNAGDPNAGVNTRPSSTVNSIDWETLGSRLAAASARSVNARQYSSPTFASTTTPQPPSSRTRSVQQKPEPSQQFSHNTKFNSQGTSFLDQPPKSSGFSQFLQRIRQQHTSKSNSNNNENTHFGYSRTSDTNDSSYPVRPQSVMPQGFGRPIQPPTRPSSAISTHRHSQDSQAIPPVNAASSNNIPTPSSQRRNGSIPNALSHLFPTLEPQTSRHQSGARPRWHKPSPEDAPLAQGVSPTTSLFSHYSNNSPLRARRTSTGSNQSGNGFIPLFGHSRNGSNSSNHNAPSNVEDDVGVGNSTTGQKVRRPSANFTSTTGKSKATPAKIPNDRDMQPKKEYDPSSVNAQQSGNSNDCSGYHVPSPLDSGYSHGRQREIDPWVAALQKEREQVVGGEEREWKKAEGHSSKVMAAEGKEHFKENSKISGPESNESDTEKKGTTDSFSVRKPRGRKAYVVSESDDSGGERYDNVFEEPSTLANPNVVPSHSPKNYEVAAENWMRTNPRNVYEECLTSTNSPKNSEIAAENWMRANFQGPSISIPSYLPKSPRQSEAKSMNVTSNDFPKKKVVIPRFPALRADEPTSIRNSSRLPLQQQNTESMTNSDIKAAWREKQKRLREISKTDTPIRTEPAIFTVPNVPITPPIQKPIDSQLRRPILDTQKTAIPPPPGSNSNANTNTITNTKLNKNPHLKPGPPPDNTLKPLFDVIGGGIGFGVPPPTERTVPTVPLSFSNSKLTSTLTSKNPNSGDIGKVGEGTMNVKPYSTPFGNFGSFSAPKDALKTKREENEENVKGSDLNFYKVPNVEDLKNESKDETKSQQGRKDNAKGDVKRKGKGQMKEISTNTANSKPRVLSSPASIVKKEVKGTANCEEPSVDTAGTPKASSSDSGNTNNGLDLNSLWMERVARRGAPEPVDVGESGDVASESETDDEVPWFQKLRPEHVKAQEALDAEMAARLSARSPSPPFDLPMPNMYGKTDEEFAREVMREEREEMRRRDEELAREMKGMEEEGEKWRQVGLKMQVKKDENLAKTLWKEEMLRQKEEDERKDEDLARRIG